MSGISQDFTVNGQAALVVSPSGNAIVGGKLANVASTGNATSDALSNALIQDARAGFLMIPTINGAPTATPQETIPGAVPLVFDVTSNTIFAYVGGNWLQSAPATTSNAITTYTDPQTPTPSPTPTPTPGGASPSGSILTSTSGTLTDNSGNTWLLNYYPLPTPVPAPTPTPSPSFADGNGSGISGLGATSATTSSVTVSWTAPVNAPAELLYVFQYKRWCDFTWAYSGPPFTGTTVTISGLPSNTIYQVRVKPNGGRFSFPTYAITNAVSGQTGTPDGWIVDYYDISNPPSNAITDSSGNKWTMVRGDDVSPYYVAVNGTVDSATANVINLYKSGGRVYQQNKTGVWRYKTLPSDSWTSASDPRAGAPPGIYPPASYTTAASADNVPSWHGGDIANDMQITLVYYGPNWNNGGQPVQQASLTNALKTLLSGPYFKAFSEYYIFSPPRIVNEITVSTTPPSTPAESDHQSFIAGLFDNGQLTPPSIDNHTFFILYQDGVSVSGLLGEHFEFFYNGNAIRYGFGLGWTPTAPQTMLDGRTLVCGHEFVEAMTDPQADQSNVAGVVRGGWWGWVGPTGNPSNAAAEIEDYKLTLGAAYVGGIWVQGFYSNYAGAYIIPTAAPSSLPSWPPPPPVVPSTSPIPSPTPSGAVPNYKGRMNLIGVNISGAEYGTPGTGKAGTDYTYPTPSEISYFASKGLNTIRLPFNMERLQPTQNGALNSTELSYIQQVVSAAANNNIIVILDPHNFGTAWGNMIGSAGTPVSAFANFWGAVAQAFNNAPNVIFGLMNEPNQQTAAQWAQADVAAIAAIRQTGAHNQILVPGTSYTGAWTWTTSGNSDAINPTAITDPANNIAFEVHQYLDSDGSGTNYGPITDLQIGVTRLTAVTQWARSVGATLFLGEIGVPTDSQSLTAFQNTLAFMEQNSTVWQGLTYWAAGQWLGTYAFSVEPTNGQDTAQMGILNQLVPGGPLATGYVAPGG